MILLSDLLEAINDFEGAPVMVAQALGREAKPLRIGDMVQGALAASRGGGEEITWAYELGCAIGTAMRDGKPAEIAATADQIEILWRAVEAGQVAGGAMVLKPLRDAVRKWRREMAEEQQAPRTEKEDESISRRIGK